MRPTEKPTREDFDLLGIELGRTYSLDDLDRLRRKLMMDCHPDRGGDPEEAKRINAAYDRVARSARRWCEARGRDTFQISRRKRPPVRRPAAGSVVVRTVTVYGSTYSSSNATGGWSTWPRP